MITTEHKRGIFALMVAHCAGMMDLVALPVWIGTLISQFQFDTQQAGGLVTIFLIGVAIASLVFAPRLARHDAKRMAMTGFGVAALVMAIAAQNSTFPVLAAVHLIGGLSAGTALTFTHGTVGRSQNPHRIFALVNLAIGIFGIIYLGATPNIINKFGGAVLFWSFTFVMGLAFVFAVLFFPTASKGNASQAGQASHGAHGALAATPSAPTAPFSKAVWYCIFAIALMCMVQAMSISFYERVGMERGFGKEAVTIALIVYGIVTIVPGPLAGLLEKRLAATTVVCTVPILQAIAGLLGFSTTSYPVYLVAGSAIVFATIFTHTFAFGLLAKLDPSGRANAATPVMIMGGAATGPLISGTLVKFFGFAAIGYGVVIVVLLQLLFYNLARISIAQRDKSANTLATQA